MGSRGKLLSSSSKSNLLNINVQGTKSHLMNVQGRTYRSGAASSNSRNKLPEFYSNPNSPREGQRGYRGTGQSNGSLPSVGSRTGICSPKKSSAGMTSVGGTSLSQVKPADEDGVIFAVSKKQPGVPFVFRTQTARMVSPERLNLDRRNLAICPVLEGEEQLRLLNFENNNIAKISNLRNLPNLIFLDLYNNQIKEISGLESLGTLRVLMLGKNYIRTVERLECLSKLDVLDLHSNRITKIQNLSHLRDLRVLNLAGNQIDVMENLEGLYSLTELNLRRNNIHTVHGLDQCNSLNRVYLSDNKIASFESLESIFRLNSLAELTLDGNLVASNRYYREYLIDRIKTVKTLDMRRVTDEERRVATMLVRNDEKLEKQRREHLKAERAHTISAIESVWLSKHKRRLSKDRSRSHHNHNVRGPTMKGYYEVKEKTTLLLYGSALDMLTTDNRLFADRERIEKIEIYYCDITSLSENINKLRRFSNANSYAFGHNDIRLFTQLDVLAAFNLKELSVAHNRVCKTTLFRSYIVFKLPTIEILNGKQVSQAERDSAGSKFSLVNSAPMSHLDEILSKRKDKQAATFKEGSKSRKIARHCTAQKILDKKTRYVHNHEKFPPYFVLMQSECVFSFRCRQGLARRFSHRQKGPQTQRNLAVDSSPNRSIDSGGAGISSECSRCACGRRFAK